MSVKPEQKPQLPVTFEMLRDRIEAVRQVLCPKASNAEIGVFVQVCASAQLNPFLGDIHYIPGKGGPGRPRVSRQGLQKLVERTGLYRGIVSEVVYEGEAFTVEYVDGQARVNHTPDILARAKRTLVEYPVAAWAALRMEGYDTPMYGFAWWTEMSGNLKTQSGNETVWAQYPAKMLRKAAEYDVLSRAVGDNTFTSRVYEMTVDELDEQVEAIQDAAGVTEQRKADETAAKEAAEASERDALLTEITGIEAELIDANWAEFAVKQRRLGSRMKHAKTADLAQATTAGLIAYRDRLKEHQSEFDAALSAPKAPPAQEIDATERTLLEDDDDGADSE